MTTDKNDGANSGQSSTEQDQNKAEQPITLHNPLNPNDPRKITLQDVENEQKYKEALTERD